MADTFECDYLVIGGGAAGCILARRLAENPSNRVILLEAGKTDEGDPFATDLSLLNQQDESYDWGYYARPVSHREQEILYSRAKMLGGCANHNDCAFLVPPASDFDHWVELGASGWDYDSNKSAFERIEKRLHIESSPPGNQLSRAFIDACLESGLPEINFRQQITPGSGWFPLNAKGSLRQSSSICYLHPLSDLPDNLQIMTETLAARLIVDQHRVTGVETLRGNILAKAEVILCAGSVNTPQLLLLSGIGDTSELEQLGLPTVSNLPGVGKNLLDHVAANIACELHDPCPPWDLTPCESTALIKIDDEAPAPDVLYHYVMMLRDKYADKDMFSSVEHGLKISPNVARPRSRGNLRLVSPLINVPPEINLNYLSDAEGYDRRILIAGLRFARQLSTTSSLSTFIKEEILPGPEIESDEDLLDYILETCETVYHPSGTCKMGAACDPMSVVTPDLKVKGIEGLRIADASVFPSMVSVNICNTVMMVAERAALIILQD